MEVRFVNDRGPYATVVSEVRHVPRVGETVIVRGVLREVVDVVTTLVVDKDSDVGCPATTVVMTADRASCWPVGPDPL